jgi:hypothetical protein
MCATAGAAGAAGAAGLELLDCCWGYLLRLVMFGGAAGQWAGVGAAMSAGSRSLPAHYTHYTGPWAAEKAPGQAAAATYLYDHCHHTPPRQQHSLLVDAPSSCPHTAPVADYTGSPLLHSHPRRPSRPRPAAP